MTGLDWEKKKKKNSGCVNAHVIGRMMLSVRQVNNSFMYIDAVMIVNLTETWSNCQKTRASFNWQALMLIKILN